MNAGASTQVAPRWPLPGRCSLHSRWKGVTHCPRQRVAHKHWDASAFTRGNDLPRNAQTLFGCQCTENENKCTIGVYQCQGKRLVKQVLCLRTARLVSPRMNAGVLRRDLITKIRNDACLRPDEFCQPNAAMNVPVL